MTLFSPRRHVLLAASSFAAALALPTVVHSATLEWRVTTGDWFDQDNWTSGETPTVDDTAIINNGGTANAGAAINVGNLGISSTNGSEAVAGTLRSTSSLDTGSFFIGTSGSADGAGGTSSGLADIGGNVTVGTNLVTGAARGSAANATGTLTVGGHLSLGGGASNVFVVGEALGSSGPSNSVATGAVAVQGNIEGSTGFTTVGSVLNSPGASATGTVTADRIQLETGGLQVGFANSAGASASGSLVSSAGTITTQFNVTIGLLTGDGKSASGSVALGDGALINTGDNRFLQVGRLFTNSFTDTVTRQSGSTTGALQAGQISGFGTLQIGDARGSLLDGAQAMGSLAAGAGGITGTGDTALFIGRVQNSADNNILTGRGGIARGDVTVTGGNVTGLGLVEIGVIENRGDADGKLSLRNGNFSANRMLIGAAFSTFGIQEDEAAALRSARGAFAMENGTLTLSDRLVIGERFGTPAGTTAIGNVALDKVTASIGGLIMNGSDATANQLTANSSQLTIGEALVRNGSIHLNNSTLNVTQMLSLPTLDGPRPTTGDLLVGAFPFADLDSRGSLIASDSAIHVDGQVVVALQTGGDLQLERSTLQAQSLRLATDLVSNGSLTLIDSHILLHEDFFMGGEATNDSALFSNAFLSLDGSLLDVGRDFFQRGPGVETLFHIAGTNRGSAGGYGAIDVFGNALLNGLFRFDFTRLIPAGAALFHFDVITASAIELGDYFSFDDLINVPTGYLATAGLFTENDFDILRVTLALREAGVPLPGTLALLLLGLLSLRAPRATRRH